MESTGNYWVPLYDFLQAANIDVCLVNARHVKGVPGRKTDVQDAQWLQQLHTAGLLNASFVTDISIRRMCYLYRQREDLIRNGAREIQHMQKAMNVQLHHVISDIDGLSGRRIIEAIIEGQRDPLHLAMLRHSRCKTPLEGVLKALDGNYCDEYVFVLRQAYERWKESQRQIAEVERFLGELLQAYQVDDTVSVENGLSTAPEDALPEMSFSGGCVAAGDWEGDGDTDLFVGARVIPGEYPTSAASRLLINDGKGRFADAQAAVLADVGMVTDAVWADVWSTTTIIPHPSGHCIFNGMWR